MERKKHTDKVDKDRAENEIDIIKGLAFVRKNWKCYLAVILISAAVGLAYCTWGIERVYECTAVLYYPEQRSIEAEEVASRDLMDDALEVIQQERMLSFVEQKTGIPWKQIQSDLTVSGNAENGIIRIVCRSFSAREAADCVAELVSLFDGELKEIVPIGDMIILQEPEEPEVPVETEWEKVMTAAVAAGCAAATGIAWVWNKNNGYIKMSGLQTKRSSGRKNRRCSGTS